jgi:hypothetical protein
MPGAAFARGLLTSSWMVGSLLCRSIGLTARVPARRRCRRLGRRTPFLHQRCGDLDVGHGCVGLGRRVGLLEACQRRTQVGLRAIEHRHPASSNSRRRSRAHGGTTLAPLLCPPLGTVHVGLDPLCFSESIAPTRGGSFVEATRTRRRVDLWSFGEMWIRTF